MTDTDPRWTTLMQANKAETEKKEDAYFLDTALSLAAIPRSIEEKDLAQAKIFTDSSTRISTLNDRLDSMLYERALVEATHVHYKGGLYKFITYATDSETKEQCVVYAHLWPHEKGIWVRPAALFDGLLPDGRRRFEPLCAK